MKKLISFFAILCFPIILSANSPIAKAFIAMPDAYYLTLSQKMRTQLLEAYQNDSNAAQKNRFRGESSIYCIDERNDFLSVKNSLNGQADFKILRNAQYVPTHLVVIFTACAPLCNSNIGFYNANWEFLPKPLLPDVSTKDFLDVNGIKADGKTAEEITEQLGMAFMQYAFVDNGNDISVCLQADKSLEAENYERLKRYLKTEKLYFKWKDGNYILSEK